METTERWYIGTILQVTLDVDCPKGSHGRTPAPEDSITVWAKVVRHCSDGVGLNFVFAKRARRNEFERFFAHLQANQK